MKIIQVQFKTPIMKFTSFIWILFPFVFTACTSIPQGVNAIQQFEKEKYLGKWYEVARLDNRFEKNLNQTTAEYSIRNDGKIKVVNSGYDTLKNEWTDIEGKAKFAKTENVGMLKVSFFGPFYAGYNILDIDPDYQYALVGGGTFKYLWILSREPELPESIKKRFLQKAENAGYNTSDLIWVEQKH